MSSLPDISLKTNPSSPFLLFFERHDTPHAFYTHLRSTEPMVYVEELDAWLLTTYEDALWLLKVSAPGPQSSLAGTSSSVESAAGQQSITSCP